MTDAVSRPVSRRQPRTLAATRVALCRFVVVVTATTGAAGLAGAAGDPPAAGSGLVEILCGGSVVRPVSLPADAGLGLLPLPPENYFRAINEPSPLPVVAVTPVDPVETIIDTWLTAPPKRDGSRSVSRDVALGWASVSDTVTLRDPPRVSDDPLAVPFWRAEESLRVPVVRRLEVFGRLGANCPEAETDNLRLTAATGLDWKILTDPGREVTLRCGPSLGFQDVLGSEHPQEDARWLLEAFSRVTVIGPARLEYTSSGSGGFNFGDRTGTRVNHDLGVSVPLGTVGSFRCGARYTYTRAADALNKPLLDAMSVYVGVSIGK